MNSLRAADGASHVILVIDDDYAVRNSLKFTLEVEGFKVRAYSDAQELLNEDSLPPSSCLVTDYYMPAMNGLELVAELRDRHMSIPTILITTLPSQDLRNRAKAAGIQIVEKPLLGSCLLDSIRKALDEHTKVSS
jgi:two-component system response regulator FixJ